jgi:hypothetical protein
MLRSRFKPWVFVLAVAAVCAAAVAASWNYSKPTASAKPVTVPQRAVQADLKPFDLPGLVTAADRIFRGTVLSAEPGSVEVGGGKLPIVTYRFQVEEAFLGDFETVKGNQVAEMRSLGKSTPVRHGDLQRMPTIPEMPRMTVGETYVIFANRPSATTGLSTSIGLGQGTFHIVLRGKAEESAVNEFDNRGLRLNPAVSSLNNRSALPDAGDSDSAGPVLYNELASQIRAALVKKGGVK